MGHTVILPTGGFATLQAIKRRLSEERLEMKTQQEIISTKNNNNGFSFAWLGCFISIAVRADLRQLSEITAVAASHITVLGFPPEGD